MKDCAERNYLSAKLYLTGYLQGLFLNLVLFKDAFLFLWNFYLYLFPGSVGEAEGYLDCSGRPISLSTRRALTNSSLLCFPPSSQASRSSPTFRLYSSLTVKRAWAIS